MVALEATLGVGSLSRVSLPICFRMSARACWCWCLHVGKSGTSNMPVWNPKEGFLNSRWCTPTLISSPSNHDSSIARAFRSSCRTCISAIPSIFLPHLARILSAFSGGYPTPHSLSLGDASTSSRDPVPSRYLRSSGHFKNLCRTALRSAIGFLSCQAALSSPSMTKRRVTAACVDGAETLCRKRRRLAALRVPGSTGPRDSERDEREVSSP